ncbi:hypothetical protein AAFN60_15805 [Roseibacillus persicicus]|uniref:hypothetical protein n=1 Tax=Roseibacillus persicicus TaxID=454148 RepID=UPI00398A6F4A
MKVALIHYHLRTGGVTRVISNQSAALTALGIDHLILSAGPAPANVPHCRIEELDYQISPDRISNSLFHLLLAACEQHFGGPPNLWHLHNPTLGKSTHFPALVKDLAESQTPLILQPHDFAEDNRPSNYPRLTGDDLYPVAPQIHYAFINSRDQGLLENAGLPPTNSHLLPNAVVGEELPKASANSPSENLVLYPVRGIRRKNLGEVVLLAALAPAGTRFAVSLAPENEVWQDVHDRWEQFSQQRNLPVDFNVTDRIPPVEGAGMDYQTWLEHASHLLTTSVAEGFGLAFLEPILKGKPLLGRDLPEITDDFHQEGIQPGRLYQNIPIPLSALDLPTLQNLLRERLLESYQQYGQSFHDDQLEEAWQTLTEGDSVDFGKLPEPFQEEIIQQALAGKTDYLDDLRLWLMETLAETEPTARPEQLGSYSLQRSQADLEALYQTASSAPAGSPSWLNKEEVLKQYLSPTRFHFLRS